MKSDAFWLVEQIEKSFKPQSKFDLEDCDRILRVQTSMGGIDAGNMLKFLATWDSRRVYYPIPLSLSVAFL
jgi:hypothetical protein